MLHGDPIHYRSEFVSSKTLGNTIVPLELWNIRLKWKVIRTIYVMNFSILSSPNNILNQCLFS